MKLVYRHGFGYRCALGYYEPFLRVVKPMIICNGILVSPLLTEQRTNKDCTNWSKAMKHGTDVDKDFIL